MSYMIGEKHFALVVGVAILLHVAAFVAWSMAPRQKVQDIPIRILNVRLEEAEEEPARSPSSQTIPRMQSMVDSITRDIVLPRSPSPSEKSADTARQYVREVNAPTRKKESQRGARNAELMSRYTQYISAWIQKFLVYPPEASQKGIRGNPVVRIRIDRRGNIRYHALERSTGSQILDQAALETVQRANPVPAVPNDYPPGETFEFLIPVSFNFQ